MKLNSTRDRTRGNVLNVDYRDLSTGRRNHCKLDGEIFRAKAACLSHLVLVLTWLTRRQRGGIRQVSVLPISRSLVVRGVVAVTSEQNARISLNIRDCRRKPAKYVVNKCVSETSHGSPGKWKKTELWQNKANHVQL